MIFIESIDFTTCSLVNAFSKIVFTAQGLLAIFICRFQRQYSRSLYVIVTYRFHPRFLSISDIVVHLVSIMNEYHRLAIFSIEQAGRIVRNI